MIDLSVRGLVKGFEQGNDILKGITFDVNAGERVGILGRNGCGKTTFFRILSGELQPDAGTVSIASGRRLGLISQIPVYPDGWTTEDVLREAHRRLYDMEARMNELTARMATDDSPALLSEYDRLSENFRRLGGYDMEHERNRVANGLDIPAAMRAQPFDSLSGGEKTRVNLARLILEDTDILLLDEPTNHLDLRATEWLEAYLLHFRGTVLVISHDRYFLDRVVQRSIDFTSGQAEFYSGNYSFYVVERQRRFDEQLKKYEKDQAKHQQHKHRAQNVDAAVTQRIGQGGVTGTKEPQQGGCSGVEHHGQHHREEQQHGKAVGDDLLRLLLVALSQRNGGAGCAARAHQHGECVQQHKDGGEQSHAGQRCRADAGNMSDVNAVHDVIQQVDHLCNDRRDHELQHQLFYAAAAHILFCLCHGCDSPLTSNLNYLLYYTQNPQKY